MMMPVRSLEISPLLEAGVADRLVHGDMVPAVPTAMEAHGAAVDDAGFGRIERGARHETWLRKPMLGVTPGREGDARLRASRREARHPAALLPMDETIPMPVTTTRRINYSQGFPLRPLRHGVAARAGLSGQTMSFGSKRPTRRSLAS
jgi:hypothetical protein